MAVQSVQWREINEKRKLMFERWGVALLSLQQVKDELGCKDTRTAKKFLDEFDVPSIAVGRNRKYEIDLLAKTLVRIRGMN